MGELSRDIDKVKYAHWKLSKHGMRYLLGSKGFGILCKSKHENNEESRILHKFKDVSFGTYVEDLKSTSGFLLLLEEDTVSWRSMKQTNKAKYTFESEYFAISFSVHEALWTRKILTDTGLEYK